MKKIFQLASELNNRHGAKLDHWWLGYLLCLAGFALTILAFYPGFMSPDSIANLTSGRTGVYYDINSPVMSWLWGELDVIYPGPAPMLILHNLIFWSGCAVFWQATRRRSAKLGLGLVLLGFMPQILSQLTTIWKDVGLAVSLFFVAAILHYSAQTGSKIVLLITPVFLFYGFAARLNAFPAIIPLIVWTGIIVCGAFGLSLSRRKKAGFVALFSLIYFSVLAAASFLVNRQLTSGRTVYPFQQVFLYDLAAISKGRNEPLFPEYILRAENFSFENVKAEYNVRSVNTLIYGDRPNTGDPPLLKLSQNPAEIDALQKKWIETVWNHKSLYLRHRFFVFAQLTGFTWQTVTLPFWDPGFRDNPAEFRREPNLLNLVLMKYFSLFRKHLFFRGFFWLALSLLMICGAFRNKFRDDWQIVFFLSLSAVLYALAYFPTTPSTEFRYILWSELATAAAAMFAVRPFIHKILIEKKGADYAVKKLNSKDQSDNPIRLSKLINRGSECKYVKGL